MRAGRASYLALGDSRGGVGRMLLTMLSKHAACWRMLPPLAQMTLVAINDNLHRRKQRVRGSDRELDK